MRRRASARPGTTYARAVSRILAADSTTDLGRLAKALGRIRDPGMRYLITMVVDLLTDRIRESERTDAITT